MGYLGIQENKGRRKCSSKPESRAALEKLPIICLLDSNLRSLMVSWLGDQLVVFGCMSLRSNSFAAFFICELT